MKRSHKIYALFFSLSLVLFSCGGGGGGGNANTNDTNVVLQPVAITPTNPRIAIGTTLQCIATGISSHHTAKDLTTQIIWSSSNPDVATIDSSGLVTATSVGTTTITATDGTTTASTKLTVTAATLQSISVTPTNPTIAKGTMTQFTATGIYSDNSTQDITTIVTWSSLDSGVASVSMASGSIGKAVSASAGTTTITATDPATNISGSSTLTVTAATLVSIAVSPTNPAIALGTAQQFSATGTYSDNSTQDITASVTWSSSAAAAAISNDDESIGLATAAANGSTMIKATWGGISGSTTLTVTPATLVSLAITPTNPGMPLGTTAHFFATGTYSDGSTQDLTTEVAWGSSQASVAVVSNAPGSQGLVTPIAIGSTTIAATAGNISGGTTLIVTPATLVSLAITPSNPSLALGTTQQFIATGEYSDGSTQNLTATVTWGSSQASIAAISNAAGSKGFVMPLATGTTMITAAAGGISSSTNLTVTPATLVSVAVTPSNPSVALGTTRQFIAMGTYTDGSTQNLTTTATWGSSKSSVATVSNAVGSKGFATPVATGTATITATLEGKSGSTVLTVTPAILTSIVVTPPASSITAGSTLQFSALGLFSDSTTQDLTGSATWSSSDTSVATISNAANSKGLATAVVAGSTVISCARDGVSGTASLEVTPPPVVTLTWDAPTSYSDGTPLNPSVDIASYKIYYGTSSGVYTHVVSIPSPSTATVTETLTLTHGTFYFAVSAVDSAGQESDYSGEEATTI
jgi:hypothetical protein